MRSMTSLLIYGIYCPSEYSAKSSLRIISRVGSQQSMNPCFSRKGAEARIEVSSLSLRCFSYVDLKKSSQAFHRCSNVGSEGAPRPHSVCIPVFFTRVRYSDFSGGNLSCSIPQSTSVECSSIACRKSCLATDMFPVGRCLLISSKRYTGVP